MGGIMDLAALIGERPVSDRERLLSSVQRAVASVSPDEGWEASVGAAIGAALGGGFYQGLNPSQEVVQYENRNRILGNIDTTNPESLKAGILAAREMGDSKMALALTQRLEGVLGQQAAAKAAQEKAAREEEERQARLAKLRAEADKTRASVQRDIEESMREDKRLQGQLERWRAQNINDLLEETPTGGTPTPKTIAQMKGIPESVKKMVLAQYGTLDIAVPPKEMQGLFAAAESKQVRKKVAEMVSRPISEEELMFGGDSVRSVIVSNPELAEAFGASKGLFGGVEVEIPPDAMESIIKTAKALEYINPGLAGTDAYTRASEMYLRGVGVDELLGGQVTSKPQQEPKPAKVKVSTAQMPEDIRDIAVRRSRGEKLTKAELVKLRDWVASQK